LDVFASFWYLRSFDAIWALESALDFDPSAALDRLYLYLERVFLLKGNFGGMETAMERGRQSVKWLEKGGERALMAQKRGRLASSLARARGGASI